MYSFERDDKDSFAYISRIYNVYDGDDRTSPILALVAGYDEVMDKYFVCYLAAENFKSRHNHYPDRSIDTWKEIMNEFIVLFECMFDKTDLLEENHYTRERIEEMPELTRENLLYYVGSCDYDEIRELPIVIDDADSVADEAIQKKYLIPAYYEESFNSGMVEYNEDEFLQFIIDEEYTESMYFTIDFNKINN